MTKGLTSIYEKACSATASAEWSVLVDELKSSAFSSGGNKILQHDLLADV